MRISDWSSDVCSSDLPDLLLYATTRRGYRAGGFNVPKLDASVANLQNFAPETLTDIEVGTKGRYSVSGLQGTFSLALYRGKDKGYQYYQGTTGVPLLPAAGIIFNKADLTTQGFEADVTIRPLSGLLLDANVAYTQLKIDRLTIPASLLAAYTSEVLEGSLAQTVITFQPKWKANASFDYKIADVMMDTSLILNGDLHYRSEEHTSELKSLMRISYAVLCL